MSQNLPENIPTDFLVHQTKLILSSYKKWTGKDLIKPSLSQNPSWLFYAPFVVVTSNSATDPILNYGNQQALNLWEMPWEKLTQTPGRHTAEPMHRDERQKFLETVQRNGFIADYSGVRISSTGKRFKIEQAIVWNLLDASENYLGQAATFKNWHYVD